MTCSAARPRIAVLLDENTSGDGRRYDTGKNYFTALVRAGGAPFGIPYHAELVGPVLDDFDALLAVGGRFAYPDAWYLDGDRSKAPPSDRLAVEQALMQGFLERRKPVLGLCAGMQMLACLAGCRLTSDLRAWRPDALEHDRAAASHAVAIVAGTRLAAIVGTDSLVVNSFHREAVASLSPGVTVSAHAPDGLVEAVELSGHPFAIGLQWHQERLIDEAHAGNAVFEAFVQAAG